MEKRYYVASDDNGEDNLFGPFDLKEAREFAKDRHWGDYGPAMVLRKVEPGEEK